MKFVFYKANSYFVSLWLDQLQLEVNYFQVVLDLENLGAAFFVVKRVILVHYEL